MHTNCALSKFLLDYRYRKYHRVLKTSSLARLVRKVSHQTLKRDVTRSLTGDEKAQLRFIFDHSVHHAVVSANILLFLERRNYIDIKVDEFYQGNGFEWNEQVLQAAIEDQQQCLLDPEDGSGAWTLSHFVGDHQLCEYVLANQVELAKFADDICGLTKLSLDGEVQ